LCERTPVAQKQALPDLLFSLIAVGVTAGGIGPFAACGFLSFPLSFFFLLTAALEKTESSSFSRDRASNF